MLISIHNISFFVSPLVICDDVITLLSALLNLSSVCPASAQFSCNVYYILRSGHSLLYCDSVFCLDNSLKSAIGDQTGLEVTWKIAGQT